MQDYKRNAFMEADLQCSTAIQSMGKRLRAACHASDASINNVVKVSGHCLVALILHVKDFNLIPELYCSSLTAVLR